MTSSDIRVEAYLKENHERGICPVTGKEAVNVYTDHSKLHIDEEGTEFRVSFNSCGLCGENKTTGQRLVELEQRKRLEDKKRRQR